MNVVWRQPSIWSCAATGFSQRVSSSSSTCRRLSSGISFQVSDFLSLSASRRVRPLGLVLSTWNFLRDFLPFVLDMSLSGDRTWEITSRAEAEDMWSVPTGSTIFFLLSMFLPVDLSSLDGAAADFLGRLRNGILDGAHYTGHVYYRSHLFFSSSSQRLCPGMYPNTLAASGKAARASQDFFLTGNRPAMSSDEATNSHRIQSSHFSSPYPSFFLRSFPSTRYSPHDPQSLSAHARAMYLCK